MTRKCIHVEEIERIFRSLRLGSYSSHNFSVEIELEPHSSTCSPSTNIFYCVFPEYANNYAAKIVYRTSDGECHACGEYDQPFGFSTSQYKIVATNDINGLKSLLDRMKWKILNVINECNCGNANELRDNYNNFIDKYNDLARNSVTKSSFERLETEYRTNIADYNELLGRNRVLQERYEELTRRFDRLNGDNEELRERNEEIRVRHEEETRD